MVYRLIQGIIGTRTLAQFFRYLFAGLLNTALTFALFWALLEMLQMPYVRASLLTWLVGISINFAFVRFWVFQAAAIKTGWAVFSRHLLFHVVYYAVNLLGLVALVEGAHLRPVPAQALLLIILVPINFLVSRRLVFRIKAG